MESISNGVEDYLIDGLSFKLPAGSSYITERKKARSGLQEVTYIRVKEGQK